MHDVSNISVKVLSLLQVARISNEGVWIPKSWVRVHPLRGEFQATLNMALPHYDWMSWPMSEMFWWLYKYWGLPLESAGGMRARKGLSLCRHIKLIHPLCLRWRLTEPRVWGVSLSPIVHPHGGRKVLDSFDVTLLFLRLLFRFHSWPSVYHALSDRPQYAYAALQHTLLPMLRPRFYPPL
jgi:hypothetical protein